MLLLMQRLGEQFMKQQTAPSIHVEGGGSKVGIEALIEGSVDICATSRPLSTDEIQRLAQRYQSIGVSVLCAKDALSIVVHPTNTVRNLTMNQVKAIFTGAIKNWKEIGGDDRVITTYGRETNSGTYLYFEEHVLFGEQYSEESVVIPGARALINAIAQDSTAIGYSTFVYTENVASLSVDGVPLSIESVQNGTYPITRYLYFYTVYPPEGAIKKFIDWVIGKEGQNVVKTNGYIPLYNVE